MSPFYRGEHLVFFTVRPSDLIATLTYFLMVNFCPCLDDDLDNMLGVNGNGSDEDAPRITGAGSPLPFPGRDKR